MALEGDFREKLKRVESIDVLKTSFARESNRLHQKRKKIKQKSSKMSKSWLVFVFNSQS